MTKEEEILKCSDEVIHKDIVEMVCSSMESKEKYIELSALYKLFADPTRIRILCALQKHEMCVCDIGVLMGVTKSAVSHQLRQLKAANLVKFRRDGQIVYYSLADEHVNDIIKIGLEHLNE